MALRKSPLGRIVGRGLSLTLGLASIAAAASAQTVAPASGSAEQRAVHRLQQDVAAAEILRDLKAGAPKRRIVLRGVRLVDPVAGVVTPGMSVIVSGRRIAWVGPTAKLPAVRDVVVIDGGDHYLAPALADMHVHTNNHGDWLLDLAAGVTTVRDMAGFPWMLKARESVNADRELGPSSYVAAPLINGNPLEGYAVVPSDAADARRIVREEAACGYDFVKVHNIVPEAIFDAVAEQAKALDMDLVGHVPHDMSVRHAAQHGMRTMEHLKGFLNDATLKSGDTDYAAVVDGPLVWNTPTLSNGLGDLWGPKARARLAAPEMRYAPKASREAWAASLDEPEGESEALLEASRPIQLQIMAKLTAEHARFLAGTDSANYPFQVRGFALLDELDRLQQAGLTPLETVRAATSEPPKATRDPDSFGEIRVGLRADLVLLDRNPLEDASAYRGARAVMAHGWWLERAALDRALDRLASAYAEDDRAVAIDATTGVDLLKRLSALSAAGSVFNAGEIASAAGALRASGLADLADKLQALAWDPVSGPCAQYRPR